MESDAIKKITDAYLLHCPYSEEKRKAIVRKPRIFTLSDCRSSAVMENHPDLDKIIIWSEFAAQLAPLIKPLILFSYSLKDFVRLNVLDKIICLKCGFFEIWLVHISHLVNRTDGAITFSNGHCMSKTQLANIYDTEFVDRLLNFCDCINDLQLSDTVIALYSLVILHNPDQQGLHSPIAVAQVHAKFLRLLKYQLTKCEKKDEIFEILVSLLPELYTFGKQHLQSLTGIWRNNSQNDIPYFLSELFEFATDEEDVLHTINNISLQD